MGCSETINCNRSCGVLFHNGPSFCCDGKGLEFDPWMDYYDPARIDNCMDYFMDYHSPFGHDYDYALHDLSHITTGAPFPTKSYKTARMTKLENSMCSQLRHLLKKYQDKQLMDGVDLLGDSRYDRQIELSTPVGKEKKNCSCDDALETLAEIRKKYNLPTR